MSLPKLPEDCYIKVKDVNTRYWCLGNSKNNLILLHGGAASVEFWLYNIHPLAQNHRVYAIDMVGSGKSDRPSGSYSLDYQAQFVVDFMDTMAIDRASFIGNSMGGSVSLKIAIAHPTKVNKIILISSFGLGAEIATNLKLLAAFPQSLKFLPVIANSLLTSAIARRRFLQNNVYDPDSISDEWTMLRCQIFALGDRQDALEQLIKNNLSPFGQLPSMYREILHQLPNINQPTLIMWGKQDPVIPVSHGHVAHEYLPNSRLEIFDRCGHWMQLEYPSIFNQYALEFLAN
jgi:4,5:9,10-diseco-3-hydroxy-5,9,17-trioxoandrosta-1(10),2-diene-4-oate hydrolase